MALKIVFNPLTGTFDLVTDPAGHVVQDEGVDLPQQAVLNFVGAGVTVVDNVGNNSTDVTITGTSTGTSRAFAYFIS